MAIANGSTLAEASRKIGVDRADVLSLASGVRRGGRIDQAPDRARTPSRDRAKSLFALIEGLATRGNEVKANKLLDSQGLCVRRQHDINEHCGVVGDDAERRMFCKSCPLPTIRVSSASWDRLTDERFEPEWINQNIPYSYLAGSGRLTPLRLAFLRLSVGRGVGQLPLG